MAYRPNAPPPPYEMQVPQQPIKFPQQPGISTIRFIGMNFGPESTFTQCPACNASILTRTEKVTTTKTHTIALILCLLGCCPCAVIPYCLLDGFKATNHYCPACGAFLATYNQ